MYDLIYGHLHSLYKCKIDHSFIINYLSIKNKKREGKRFLYFLEGAKSQLSQVLNNELLKFDENEVRGMPSIFEDARGMVATRRRREKEKSFPELLKQHS